MPTISIAILLKAASLGDKHSPQMKYHLRAGKCSHAARSVESWCGIPGSKSTASLLNFRHNGSQSWPIIIVFAPGSFAVRSDGGVLNPSYVRHVTL
jgi:hypothetical protein